MRPLSPSSESHSARRRRLALGGLLATATLTCGALVSTPAYAVGPSPITTKSGLATAFGSDGNLRLDNDLDGHGGTAEDDQTVSAGKDIQLDLNGHRLNLTHLKLEAGSKLTIVDSHRVSNSDNWDDNSKLVVNHTQDLGSTDTAIELVGSSRFSVTGARVDAIGADGGAGIGTAMNDAFGGGEVQVGAGASVYGQGGHGGAGIGGGSGAKPVDLTVDGGDVNADGGKYAAGIGGGSGKAGGSVTIKDTDENDDNYPSVYADGGDGASGIGGGLNGAGGAVDIVDGGVTATNGSAVSSTSASAIGAGEGGLVPGSLTIAEDGRLTVQRHATLRIPAPEDVLNAGRIYVDGALTGDGTIENSGSVITRDSDYDGDDDPDDAPISADNRIDPAVKIKGHNYLVTFDGRGGTVSGTSSLHVYTNDLWRAERTVPDASNGQDGYGLFSWNIVADGSGKDLYDDDLATLTGHDDSDGLTAIPLPVYAQYGKLVKFTGTSVPDAGIGVAYDQALPVVGDRIYGYYPADWDDDGNALPTLPPGLSLDSNTGHLTGIPTQAGTFAFTVEADGPGSRNWATQKLTMTVAGAPVVATSTLASGTVGAAYRSGLAYTGLGPVTWSLASGSLPAGLTLDSSGVVSGIPTAAGASAFVARATSRFGSTLAPLTLTIAPAAVVATPPAPAPAPAAPKLPSIGKQTVKFGHQVNLGVTANSTLPVTYAISKGALPKGVSLNKQTGVISGQVAEVGSFDATVTATSSAGSASTTVSIVVPQITELVKAHSEPAVKVGAGTVPVKVSGFKKGERWTVRVDGKAVAHGKMKRAGTLKTTVHLKKAKKDKVHTVTVSGSRKVSDPAVRASTSFQVTSLAAKKHLGASVGAVVHGKRAVTISHLAAGEKVTVKAGGKTVAKGHANAKGAFSFLAKAPKKGSTKLVAHGAAVKRSTTVKVKGSKH